MAMVQFYTGAKKPTNWNANSFYLFTSDVVDGSITYKAGLYFGNKLLTNNDELVNAIASIEALSDYVGTIPVGEDGKAMAENIVAYINKKTEGIATDAALAELQGALQLLQEAVEALSGRVDTLEGLVGKTNTEGLRKDVADLKQADIALDGRLDTVEEKLANVTSPMDFVGTKTTVPAGDELKDYQKGDVIIVGDLEYVFDGARFVEIGNASANATAISGIQEQLEKAFETDGKTVKKATHAENATNAAQLDGVAADAYAIKDEVVEKLENYELKANLKSAAYSEASAFATSAQGELADSAVQPEDIKDGTAQGTILVGSTAINVGGLQDAAYETKASILAAAKAEAQELDNQVKEDLVGTDNFHETDSEGNEKYPSTIGGAKQYAHDIAVGASAVGVQSAKAYTESEIEKILKYLTWQEIQ